MTGVRAHVRAHFAAGEPDAASVTFLGLLPIEVLRFGPDPEGVTHYVSVGGSRHAEGTPTEVVVSLQAGAHLSGLARSVAVVAAAPAVEGLMLTPDALVDLGQPLWEGAPFTAVLLDASDIASVDG
ncbi:MAG: suppressor of fused domain protein, partial [Mycobacterium sp.]